MVTQKDVAKLAGVSFITVSRVVNNEGNVKEETRQKVEDAIRQLGYFPSFAGKALNCGHNDTIGVMTPASFGDGMENAYLMGVLRGIELACREQGQDILLSPMSSVKSGFDYLRPYRQRKVDGMIYVGMMAMPAEMISEIGERTIPCVVVGDRPAHANISWIDTDNERAGYETTKRIWEKGHRRIAFLGLLEELHNENIADRERGFRRAMRELSGAVAPEELVFRTDYSPAKAKECVRKLLADTARRPSAIFFATDSMLLAGASQIHDMGLSVPADISLVGFDGFIREGTSRPTFASNEQPLIAMGHRAAEILLEEIANPATAKREEIFPVKFIDGESLGTVPRT